MIYGATMASLSRQLAVLADREVIDKTGLAGEFDIHFEFSVDDLNPSAPLGGAAGLNDPAAAPPTDAALFNALRNALPKLGLRIEQAKGPGDFLIVEHVERPSDN